MLRLLKKYKRNEIIELDNGISKSKEASTMNKIMKISVLLKKIT
jgi:hypothetical protein